MSRLKDTTLFQKYCENSIGKISEDCVEQFTQKNDDISRIRLMYDVAKKIPIQLSETNGKSFIEAELQKSEGNKFFAKKDYTNALKHYNKGIIKCPQTTAQERNLLTILISNRSATSFELKEYKKVFNDIDYITEIGDYPRKLKYKIWLRKGRCYDELKNERSAVEAYNEALKYLKDSDLDEKTIKQKTKEIENFKNNNSLNKKKDDNQIVAKKDIELLINKEHFTGGQEYIAANSKITFEQDIYQGRYARALDDIEAGAILVEENAFCSVVDCEHALSNCQYCLTSVDQPIACSGCTDVAFCSTHCERVALKSFHGVECGIQKLLLDCGASVNCFMALRLISQKPLKFFRDKNNKLKDYMKDCCKKNVIKKKVYRSDDYDNVFFLCRNEQLRNKQELIHYACISIYLLRLIKFANYFGDFDDNLLTDDELFIGGLILRHFQLLQFNAHEISELRNVNQPLNNSDLLQMNFENANIGAGVYPTLALFNHSCDPSIVRYNIKNKMIVRAIKPIKAGAIIYENYGPMFTAQPIKERQEELKNNYWFECLCQPCVELWPMFHEMKENELRIPCKTDRCPFVFSVNPEDDPFLICDYCHEITNIFPYLKGLMVLEQLLPEAENLLALGQIENALTKFLKALELLFKYSRPPHPEIVKVQQRVRMCMLHLGNKSFDYIQSF